MFLATDNLIEKIRHLKADLLVVQGRVGIPSVFTRLWLPYTVGAVATWTIVKTYSLNAEWLARATRETWSTAYAFVSEWIVEPLHNMYNTVRHKERRLAIMGSQSLNSDFESLERMVVAFAKDHGVQNLESIRSSVQNGDMTVVMETYEDEMKKPFIGTVKGMYPFCKYMKKYFSQSL
jgi:nuclear-control-of-ATPase protein 2